MQTASAKRQKRIGARKPLVLASVIVAVMVAAVVTVWTGVGSAEGQARQYESDFKDWNEQVKPDVLKATAVIPRDTYVFTNQSSSKNLATQKSSCDKIDQIVDMLARAGKEVPLLERNIFGSLSNAYAKAKSRSDKRHDTTKAYLGEAQAAYRQILTDCQWNIKVNMAAAKAVKLHDAAEEHLQAYGEEQGGSVCNDTGGCLPEDDVARKKYLEMYKRATEAALNGVVPLFEPQHCKATSFASSCNDLHDRYEAVYLASMNYVKVAASLKTVIDSQKIIAANKAYAKANDALDKTMKAAFERLYPDFTQTAQLKNNPSQIDGWLDAAAQGRIKALAAKQAALKHL